MKRRTLAMHKQAAKVLRAAPAFSTIKRGKLPKPLDRVGGPSVQMTNLIEVGDGYSVWFMWKDGETLVQSAPRDCVRALDRLPTFLKIPSPLSCRNVPVDTHDIRPAWLCLNPAADSLFSIE